MRLNFLLSVGLFLIAVATVPGCSSVTLGGSPENSALYVVDIRGHFKTRAGREGPWHWRTAAVHDGTRFYTLWGRTCWDYAVFSKLPPGEYTLNRFEANRGDTLTVYRLYETDFLSEHPELRVKLGAGQIYYAGRIDTLEEWNAATGKVDRSSTFTRTEDDERKTWETILKDCAGKPPSAWVGPINQRLKELGGG